MTTPQAVAFKAWASAFAESSRYRSAGDNPFGLSAFKKVLRALWTQVSPHQHVLLWARHRPGPSSPCADVLALSTLSGGLQDHTN